MSHPTSTFPHDLGISSRVGLTRGVGTLTGSFAEAEMHYRQDRFLADALRHREQVRASRPRGSRSRGSQGREVMSRWSTWFSSALHRSSPAR